MADNVNAFLNGFDLDALEGLLELEMSDFEYKGFTPGEFLKHLLRLANQRGIPQSTLRKDLFQLAVIGTFRGNNVERIQNRATDGLQRFMQSCVTNYGLVSKAGNSNTTVTLARVAACLAREVGIAYFKRIITLDSVVSTTRTIPNMTMPKPLCLSTYGALIPAENSMAAEQIEMLEKAYCYHQYLFNGIITRGARVDKAVVSGYAMIQKNSQLYSPEERIAYNTTVGLIASRGPGVLPTITNTHSSVITEMVRRWDEL